MYTFENNKGSEELSKVPKYRPRTKHIAIKYHHFREWVKNGTIKIQRVITHYQQVDILTKPLPMVSYENLRLNLLSWYSILVRNDDDHTYIQKSSMIIK